MISTPHHKRSGVALRRQQFNNLRSLALQTMDFVTNYRWHLYSPFVAFPGHKIVFLAVPRAGTTSLEFSLTPLLGPGLDFTAPRYEHTFRHYMYSCTRRQAATRFSDCFKFTFVRNPWTRLYSCYLTRVVTKPNRYFRRFGLDKCRRFDDFVRRVCEIPDERADKHFVSQDYLLTYGGAFLPDAVYRFEAYRQDCQTVRKIIENRTNVRLLDIPHYYPSDSDAFHQAYTPELIDRVGSRYRADCERFGYRYPDRGI